MRPYAKNAVLSLFIVAKMVLQYLVVDGVYELHRDEYLHIDQGKHLAWGYVSVPPFTSWISRLIILMGGTEFWVKFFPALFGALTLFTVWKITETLKGGFFAHILAATAVTFSVLLRINILYQPTSFDILAWTILYFFLIRYMKDQHSKWLCCAAIAFAVGFLNKYNIAFLIMGLIPAFLLTPARSLLLKPPVYLATALAMVLITPNLLWQLNEGFPVLHHMQELKRTQLVHVNRTDFFKEQLLFFFGSLFVLVSGLVSFFKYHPFYPYRTIFWSFALTLLIFALLRAKAYYAIGLYPVLLAFGAVYLEGLYQQYNLKWMQYVSILVILLLAIPIFQVALPVFSPAEIRQNSSRYAKLGMLRWEDGKEHLLPQDFADMIGWKELARKVDAEYEKIPYPSHTLVLCDNYGQTGAINFYSKHKNINAVSFHADYVKWFPLEREIRNLILVQNADDDDKSREREKPMFRTIQLIGKIENPLAREFGTSIYVLRGARVSINSILRKELEMKAIYDR